MTYATFSFASIGGLTSPVNAPSSFQWQFWAPSAIGMLVALGERLERAKVGERWGDHHVARLVVLGLEPVRELLHHLDRHEVVVVHLPVRRDDRLAFGLRSSGSSHRSAAPTRAERSEAGKIAAAR